MLAQTSPSLVAVLTALLISGTALAGAAPREPASWPSWSRVVAAGQEAIRAEAGSAKSPMTRPARELTQAGVAASAEPQAPESSSTKKVLWIALAAAAGTVAIWVALENRVLR
jgi:hypothetical protein